MHADIRRLNEEATCRRIAEAREAAGLSREELAQSLTAYTGTSVRPRDVRRYEKSRVPWDLLSEIGRLTATSRGWLLYGEKFADDAGPPDTLWEEPVRIERPPDPFGEAKGTEPRLSAVMAGAGLAAAFGVGLAVERATGSIVAAMAAVLAIILIAFLRYFR